MPPRGPVKRLKPIRLAKAPPQKPPPALRPLWVIGVVLAISGAYLGLRGCVKPTARPEVFDKPAAQPTPAQRPGRPAAAPPPRAPVAPAPAAPREPPPTHTLEQAEAAMRAVTPDATDCFQRHFGGKPAAGSVGVRFQVDYLGAVSGVSVTKDDFGNSAFAACVTAAAERARLPPLVAAGDVPPGTFFYTFGFRSYMKPGELREMPAPR